MVKFPRSNNEAILTSNIIKIKKNMNLKKIISSFLVKTKKEICQNFIHKYK